MAIEIKIGIPTDGEPIIESREDYTILRNMIIGLGFHWEQVIEVILPGTLTISTDNVYKVINTLPLETYLECVIGSEMNPKAPEEFLKAHAVISRSWALSKIRHREDYTDEGKINEPELIINWEDTCDHVGFDVCSDDHCQRYQGLQPMAESLKKAVVSTSGLCLFSRNGSPVDTRFSKCCGGKTEIFASCWQDRDEPCLESFDDPWCDLSVLSSESKERILKTILKEYDLENNGGYKWVKSIKSKEIRKNLLEKFKRDIGEIKEINVCARGKSGRITRLGLIGESGKLEIGKELMIRRLLAPSHLYSSLIEIQKKDDDPETFIINGRGWGHGVGLCQIGAARMALEGFTFDKILSFYYPGAILRQLDFDSK